MPASSSDRSPSSRQIEGLQGAMAEQCGRRPDAEIYLSQPGMGVAGRTLGAALHLQAFAALGAWPGARTYHEDTLGSTIDLTSRPSPLDQFRYGMSVVVHVRKLTWEPASASSDALRQEARCCSGVVGIARESLHETFLLPAGLAGEQGDE